MAQLGIVWKVWQGSLHWLLIADREKRPWLGLSFVLGFSVTANVSGTLELSRNVPYFLFIIRRTKWHTAYMNLIVAILANKPCDPNIRHCLIRMLCSSYETWHLTCKLKSLSECIKLELLFSIFVLLKFDNKFYFKSWRNCKGLRLIKLMCNLNEDVSREAESICEQIVEKAGCAISREIK